MSITTTDTLSCPPAKCCGKCECENEYETCHCDPRIVRQYGAREAIATSSGQNDSGMFELNFRDERYLPFEGSGVISTWQLQLPGDPSKSEPVQFDYNTITDVILHLRYTAREGGGLAQTLDLRWMHVPTEWGVRVRPGKKGLTVGAINVGTYADIPDVWPYRTEMPRGAYPIPGVPAMGYSIYEKAELWDKAAEYLSRSGHKMRQMYSKEEGKSFFDRKNAAVTKLYQAASAKAVARWVFPKPG